MSTNEWYTPAKHIEAARMVMGEVDFNPASCVCANWVGKANTQNGLQRSNCGVLFLFVCFLLPSSGHKQGYCPHKQGYCHQHKCHTESCRSQPLKNGLVRGKSQDSKKKRSDNATPKRYANNHYPFAPNQKLFFTHWDILSSSWIALVYNNAEQLKISNRPRRLSSGAEQVTTTAIDTSLESEILI